MEQLKNLTQGEQSEKNYFTFQKEKKLFVVKIFARSEAFHVRSANFPSYFLALNNKQCREKNEFNMSSCAKRNKSK